MVRAPALAAASWELEGRLGGAWNAGLPIVIQQQGYENLRFTAELRTRGLDPPLYYGGRITAWQSGRGWAIDLVHHKLHLEEPPPEVRSFAISHGYNLLTLQRLFARDRWRYGAGLGAVVAHPESEVRGLVFEETQGLFRDGYYVAGVTAAGLAGHSLAIGSRFLVAAEARLTWSSARVPIAQGSARVPNLALHGTVGLTWNASR